ncbi:MAG: nitrilase family protein [Tannerella sp.]|jgi:predicted amidohydrolase|nr:nitrilase family protein [Tannerella sp.]
MEQNELIISIIQTHIAWEDKEANLKHVEELISPLTGKTDLVILPEFFTTGFSMQSSALAEEFHGETTQTLERWAAEYGFAILGSYPVREVDEIFNRAVFGIPDSVNLPCYDKRHLFFKGEDKAYSKGEAPVTVTYRGWNIAVRICYDLRFPVWSRNRDNDYDLLVYIANWPSARRRAWDSLLPARAIENMAYVCGVNRVGIDGNDVGYDGGSAVFSPEGVKMADAGSDETVVSCTLQMDALSKLRRNFPVWQDADTFLFNHLM